jgi:hypothetical protein
MVLKLTNVSLGVSVCDVALDTDTFVSPDTHSTGVIGSSEGIYFWADQLHIIRVSGRSSYPSTTTLSSSSSAATFSESVRPRVAITSVIFHSSTMEVVKVLHEDQR